MLGLSGKQGAYVSECNRVIDAEIFERDGVVYIGKTCPRHGYFEDVYFGSYEMYDRFSKYARDGIGISNPKTVFKQHNVSCQLWPLQQSP